MAKARNIPLSSMTNTKYKRPSYGAASKISKKTAKADASVNDSPVQTHADKSTLYPTKRAVDKNYGTHCARDGRKMEQM